jgi:drug/metabolite transporter (DMT)-like permease
VKPARLFILTLAAMIAFAGNSLLCRFALKQTGIDAASFTFIRLFSGATALWLIIMIRGRLMVDRTTSPLVDMSSDASLVTRHWSPRQMGNWPSALALFAYAAAFSFAYNSLSAGTGALLLFGAVQATMILWGVRKGERLHARQLIGLALALSGLIVLLFPGLSAPPVSGAILMLGAGVAWGIYSLRGKAAGDPASATAGNFLRAVPFASILSIIMLPWVPRFRGHRLCRNRSDRIRSRLCNWLALPGLKQPAPQPFNLLCRFLRPPVGIMLLGESLTPRFLIASIAVLSGIALVVLEKRSAL